MPSYGDQFTHKVVLVTGGARGIGRAICTAFADTGAHVLCMDMDVQAGMALAGGYSGLGDITFHKADASRADDCAAAVNAAVARWGGVDVVCNNVGIMPQDAYVPAHELPEAMWDRIMDVNLKSAFLMTHYAAPHMMARGGGAIINTASVQGMASAYNVSAYAASKGGMISLTRQLALDYAPHNIRVLGVAPGSINTDLLRESVQNMTPAEMAAQYAAWGKPHPLGRVGEPEEIAHVVVFLASDGASFMTGSTVCVDGGMMAKGVWA
jgi:NAD(P)-dependent dehydrogenase (short-subunit alcohol dehydrogenase family)